MPEQQFIIACEIEYSFDVAILLWLSSFLNTGQSRSLFDHLRPFSNSNNNYSLSFNNVNRKKLRWCAWDLNLRPQDGRRRQNNGAMAATQSVSKACNAFFLFEVERKIRTKTRKNISKQTIDGASWQREFKIEANFFKLLWCKIWFES